MTEGSVEDRLSRIEAEREILRTLHTYGHAVDYGWEAEFVDCFVSEATLVWPMREPMHGRDPIRAAFRAHSHAPERYHKHLLVAPLIDIGVDEDPRRARATSMFARLDPYDTIPGICAFGRYVDELTACPDGRWRFRTRVAEIEAWRHGAPPVVPFRRV